MKRSTNKAVMGLLAMLASVGIVHAEEGTLEVPVTTEQKRVILNDLLNQGFIYPIQGQPNWFEINRQRLEEMMARREAGDLSAQETIDKLKSIMGDGVDIKEVEIFQANLGGQDF